MRLRFKKRRGSLLVLIFLLLSGMMLSACTAEDLRKVMPDLAEPVGLSEPDLSPAPEVSSEFTPASVEEPAPQPSPDPDAVLKASLRISEAMPSNQGMLLDEDGDSSDWLELKNIGPEPVSLKGCWLSDRKSRLTMWQFPDCQIESGGYVLVFCSGKNRTESEYHTDFSLSKNGGWIVLSSPSGKVLDAVEYEKTEKNRAIVFLDQDGLSCVPAMATRMATPGFSNSEEGYESFLADSDVHGALVINEAVTYNDSFPDLYGNTFDWVELKNTSSFSVSLDDYWISDDADNLQKCRLPSVTLAPGELSVVFCIGDSTAARLPVNSVRMGITGGEGLFLTERTGELSDRVFLYDVPLGGSIGRLDGKVGFWYSAEPSPGQPNRIGFRTVSAPPSASVSQGVYNSSDSFEVELLGDGNIYYTLDGSVPTVSSKRYTEPISVTANTVIRAVCDSENRLISEPRSFSYIVNQNDSLPVTSLVCDPVQMFGYGGVYTAARNLHVKQDADVSFFEPDGGSFQAGCSVELHGAHSRLAYQKKSFELKFASRYGGNLSYDLFGNGFVTEFRSLLLRGGSSVSLDTVRDSFASELMYQVCPEVFPQAVRYTAVYINGKYYGIYAWREAYSEQYFADHAGARPDEVIMLRAPLGAGELLDVLNFALTHHLGTKPEYDYVAEYLDLDSLASWMAIQAYFDNQDINGNIRYVKLSENGKWKLIAYDLDYSCLNDLPSWNTVLNTYQLGPVCRSLLNNTEFQELLLRKCAEFIANGFTAENIQALYDSMLQPLDDQTVQKDCACWGEDFAKWTRYRQAMRDHLSEYRTEQWLAGLQAITRTSNEQMARFFPDYW